MNENTALAAPAQQNDTKPYGGVNFIHLRYWKPEERRDDATGEIKIVKTPLSMGGLTVAYQIDGTTARFAYAKCCVRDNFSRRRGREAAYGRLLKNRDAYEAHGVEPEVANGRREDQQSYILQQVATVLPEKARGDFFAMVSSDPMRGVEARDEPVLASE